MATKMVDIVVSILLASMFMAASGGPGNFYSDFEITWGGERAHISRGGQVMMLSIDKDSGSGFRSKREYLFSRIDMKLKLIQGESAGLVTAYYFTSQDPGHDEIDFEFLGNAAGLPTSLSTNVFTQGKGNREQKFTLWFDPTKHFHTYSIVWNLQNIIFLVDNVPIRVFENNESKGVPFPKLQAMRVYASLWHADWLSSKTDWSKAPFRAFYSEFSDGPACVDSLAPPVSSNHSLSATPTCSQRLDANALMKLRSVQEHYMTYNYCTDFQRFPEGLPRECVV